MKRYTIEELLDYFERDSIILVNGDNPMIWNNDKGVYELNDVSRAYLHDQDKENCIRGLKGE